MKALGQLTLNIRLRDDATFDNFYAQNNQQLVAHLRTLTIGKSKQFTYIWGEPGAGRSHLLQACCHAANKQGLSSIYLPLLAANELSPQILENLERISLVCIDDIQNIVQKPDWEEAIFHIFNKLQEQNGLLVISANNTAHMLQFSLADLKSRLAGGIIFQVQALTDTQKLEAFKMRAEIRGLDVPHEVAKFLLNRCRRDTTNLFSILDKLDQASLAAQRKLTIPFVKSVLFSN
jgi:DnaA family protein